LDLVGFGWICLDWVGLVRQVGRVGPCFENRCHQERYFGLGRAMEDRLVEVKNG